MAQNERRTPQELQEILLMLPTEQALETIFKSVDQSANMIFEKAKKEGLCDQKAGEQAALALGAWICDMSRAWRNRDRSPQTLQ